MKLTPNATMPLITRQTVPAIDQQDSLFRAAVSAAKTPAFATDKSSVNFLSRPIPSDGPGSTTGVVIPAADSGAKDVADWWKGLTEETRVKLIEKNSAELGQLRGLPAVTADKVNRTRVDEDVPRLEEELAQVEREIALSSRSPGGKEIPIPRSLTDKRNRIATELHNARAVKNQMKILDADTNAPTAYLLTYSPKNEGRFAVALGNPDTARDTAVLVPGAGHDVKKEDQRFLFPTVGEGQRIYNAMKGAPMGADDHSVIVWLGTDMPDAPVPQGLNGTYGDAEHGARWLHDDVKGYQAASTVEDNHMTIIAHSYGSYMTGEAVKLGLEVDDLVVFGSPGIGAKNAEELGMTGRVWAGQIASGDDIPFLSQIPFQMAEAGSRSLGTNLDNSVYGKLPTGESFGANIFSTDGTEYLKAADGHGGYLAEGSESLTNIAYIANGMDEMVTRD